MKIHITNSNIAVEGDEREMGELRLPNWFRVSDSVMFKHLFTKFPIIAAEIDIEGSQTVVVLDTTDITINAHVATEYERAAFYNERLDT